MDVTIFNLFNFIVAIFCVVTSFFLFIQASRSRKKILFPFSFYFLFVSLTLLLLFFYVIIPNISKIDLGIILLLCILLAYLAVLNLLISSFLLNPNNTVSKILTQISFALVILFVVLGFYSSNVHHFINSLPESSVFYAILLFLCYSVIYGMCIWNLVSSEKINPTNVNDNPVKTLILFYGIGIIVTFTEIFGSFVLLLNTTKLELSFMNIFTVLFIIQGILLVYSYPLTNDKSVLSKNMLDSIVNI